MIKGMYAAASAMIAGMNRQTVLSHNISNVDTPGFKDIIITMEDWEKTSVYPQESGNYGTSLVSFLSTGASSGLTQYLGELGLGVETAPELIDYTQGALQTTGEEFDLAFQGEGFFRIQTPDGEKYTRDGRFTLDAAGNLVTANGYFVLDDNGQPINLPDGEVAFDIDGTIYVDAQETSRLGLMAFENPSENMVREPSNLYSALDSAVETDVGEVHQGVLEMSNVNIGEIMAQMVSVGRAYEAAQQLLSTQDSLLGNAISTLGKF